MSRLIRAKGQAEIIDRMRRQLEIACLTLRTIERGEWADLNDSPSDIRRRARKMSADALRDIRAINPLEEK